MLTKLPDEMAKSYKTCFRDKIIKEVKMPCRFPNGHEFFIIDAKVGGGNSRSKKGIPIEDSLYEKRPDLWSSLPRGLSLIYTDRNCQELIHGICGLRKFDKEESWYGYELFGGEDVVCDIYSEKENGECFHLSGFIWEEVYYWIIGSKNVHAIFRFGHILEDIQIYKNQFRCNMLINLAKDFVKYSLENKEDGEIANALFQRLIDEESALIGEACHEDRQHIVKYDKNTIYYICETSLNSTNSLIHGNVFTTRQFLISIGLSVPHWHIYWHKGQIDHYYDYSSKNIQSLPNSTFTGDKIDCIYNDKNTLDGDKNTLLTDDLQISEIPGGLYKTQRYFRTKPNSEGAVVYRFSSKQRLLKMFKFKNIFYVYSRACRERMRAESNSMEIARRFSNLYLYDGDLCSKLCPLLIQFNAYCRFWQYNHGVKSRFTNFTKLDKKDPYWKQDFIDRTKPDIYCQWATVWDKFIKLSDCDKQWYLEEFDGGRKYYDKIEMDPLVVEEGRPINDELYSFWKINTGVCFDPKLSCR